MAYTAIVPGGLCHHNIDGSHPDRVWPVPQERYPPIINTGDFLLAGGDTEMKYLRYSLNKHKTIQHAHREANEDVWKYIVWANVLLIVAVLSMVAATIGILVTYN